MNHRPISQTQLDMAKDNPQLRQLAIKDAEIAKLEKDVETYRQLCEEAKHIAETNISLKAEIATLKVVVNNLTKHDGPEIAALREDAETLRTAVRLGIGIQQYPMIGEGFANAGEHAGFFNLSEPYGDDRMAATRRTVARCVAEIDKLQQSGGVTKWQKK